MAKQISEAKALRIEWTAHNEPWLWPALAVFSFTTAWWSTQGGPNWVLSGSLTALCGGYLVAARWRHNDLACARCWRRTPPQSMAADEVRRYRRWLWFAHVVSDQWYLVFPLVAAVWVPIPQVFLCGVVGLLAGAVCMALALNKHKQLEKWCPRCPRHGGGGDGGTYAPPPLPVVNGSKQR